MLTLTAAIARPAAPPAGARTPPAPARPRAASDPCLACRLPDCDEGSARCGLKAAARALSRARLSGDVDPEVRAAARAYFAARKIDWRAARSEVPA